MAAKYITKTSANSILPSWVTGSTVFPLYVPDVSIIPFITTSSTHTLNKNQFIVFCNTITITLPASPAEGEIHIICAYNGGLYLNPNGKTMFYGTTQHNTTTLISSYSCTCIVGYVDGVWRYGVYSPR